MSLLERINYISRLIAPSTVLCQPIFKLMKKDALKILTGECQTSFDAIKNYLSNPPVLVPPRQRSPLLVYLPVLYNTFRCVHGLHDKTEEGANYLLVEQEIHSIQGLSNSFTENVLCFDFDCTEIKTLFIFLYHIPHFQDGFVEIYFQKVMPMGNLDKSQILSSVYDLFM